jgi:hypothetical protein
MAAKKYNQPKLSDVQQQALLCIGGAQFLNDMQSVKLDLKLVIHKDRTYRGVAEITEKTVAAMGKKGLLSVSKERRPASSYIHDTYISLTDLGWSLFRLLAEENQKQHDLYYTELERVRAEHAATSAYRVTLLKRVQTIEYKECAIDVVASSKEEAVTNAMELLRKPQRWSMPLYINQPEIPRPTVTESQPEVHQIVQRGVSGDDEAVNNYRRSHKAPEFFKGVKEYLEANKHVASAKETT